MRTLVATLGALLLPGLIPLSPATADATPPIQVWYGPDNQSLDLADMFREPQLWSNARSQISVFKFGPQQLGDNTWTHINTMTDLVKVHAFELLKSWGLSLALEAPSIKEWDCTGRQATATTLRIVGNARASGGVVKYISMDEPLRSGTDSCKDSIENVAAKTAQYIEQVRANDPGVILGDIEPYPSYRPAQLEQWLTLLIRNGAKPANFHLDPNVFYLEQHREINLAADLQSLKAFLRTQGIPFGIIFTSGHGPEPTDRSYYAHTMAWVRRVHAAIGSPDHVVFQSWVTRSYPGCVDVEHQCAPPKVKCPPSDTSGCGLRSVPVNLPEGNPRIFSFTRLVNDALEILRQ